MPLINLVDVSLTSRAMRFRRRKIDPVKVSYMTTNLEIDRRRGASANINNLRAVRRWTGALVASPISA